MKNRAQTETSSRERRRALAEDVDRFLKAGNQIQYVDSGVSAQDPQGRGRPLRLGRPKGDDPKPSTGQGE